MHAYTEMDTHTFIQAHHKIETVKNRNWQEWNLCKTLVFLFLG